MSDFYSDAANQRLKVIEAERAACLADLQAHRVNSDTESAAAVVQQLANLEAERRNLTDLYNQYVQSQQPPQPEELSDAERMSRPWNKMTPDDALQLAKTSRYAKDLDWNDQNVRAGWAEAQRRKVVGNNDVRQRRTRSSCNLEPNGAAFPSTLELQSTRAKGKVSRVSLPR